MNQALDVFYELGVELCHVLWRKTAKSEAERADSFLNDVGFELLRAKRPKLASQILEYGRNLRGHHSQMIKLMIVVNLANAYRMLGEPDQCKAILATQDWTASSAEFRLAVAALEERWIDATAVIREIGPGGKISEFEYRNWPVFSGLVQRDEFRGAYEEVFGKPFESMPTQIEVATQSQDSIG